MTRSALEEEMLSTHDAPCRIPMNYQQMSEEQQEAAMSLWAAQATGIETSEAAIARQAWSQEEQQAMVEAVDIEWYGEPEAPDPM